MPAPAANHRIALAGAERKSPAVTAGLFPSHADAFLPATWPIQIGRKGEVQPLDT